MAGRTKQRRGSGAGRAVVRPHGQLRRSHVVGASGPGALIDLPKYAVIVSGLEGWGDPQINNFESIDDERTRSRLAVRLKVPGLRLYSPPVEGDTFGEKLAPGITAWAFPRWFIAQHELKPGIRPLVHARQLEKNRFIDDERKKHRVVPVRFVRACVNGHVDDIDWKGFAHRGPTNCSQQLLWSERGASGDFVDIFVGCTCGQFPPRSIIEATKRPEGKPVVGWCNGARPWLGNGPRDQCRTEDDKPVEFRLLVRNASNAYFGLMDRSISVPEPDQTLRTAVGKLIDDLSAVESPADLKYERKKKKVQSILGGLGDEAVLAELKRRRDPGAVDERKSKVAELQTFLAVKGQEGEDAPDSIFFAREQALPTPRPKLLAPLLKVLLIDRLREVSVQVGFTRFEAPSTDPEGELDLQVQSGALARESAWLPATENRGEGVFLAFDPKALRDWAKKPSVERRKNEFESGYAAWAATHKVKAPPPPIEYVLLHSLSHLMMTSLALECGYSASSIRERVYALEAGYGILLHTGTPDAEGTLGGMVHAASDVESLLRGALEVGRFCSCDPVCAQHHPDSPHEERFLHGAACHGCLLLPETSCEMRNDYLDRSLVVETVEQLGCELFGDA